jgi:hypothetical protein
MAGLDGCGKYRPHRGSIPGRPARNESLYLLRYPGPFIIPLQYKILTTKQTHSTSISNNQPQDSGLQEVEAPRISRQSAQEGVNVVSPLPRPPLPPPPPQEIVPVLISVTGRVDPTASVRPGGLSQWKIPMPHRESKPCPSGSLCTNCSLSWEWNNLINIRYEDKTLPQSMWHA